MKNKNKITKFKFFLSFEKELAFINKMNREGWRLVYIKGGCFYSFEKTEPDEYFTTIYITAKDKLQEISSFAAQCGYQVIQHIGDGYDCFLYLTGRKSEVSQDFVSEAAEKAENAKRIYHHIQNNSIIIFVMAVCIIPMLSSSETVRSIEGNTVLGIASDVIPKVIAAAYIPICICALLQTVKARRYWKQMQKESDIYE